MPVEDAVVMPILPDDGERVGSHRDDIRNSCGGRVFEFDVEYICVRFGFHILVPAPAGCTRAGRA